MLISMNWIGEFVDLEGLDKESLIKRFTLSTAEVEDIFHMGENLRDVVVGEILTIENHPNSKKLHLLTVDAGDKVYDVVCGAPNVRVGMKIPFVKEGGRVEAGEITTATIAGYVSHGMCCSESELGISADHSGLWELPSDLVNGTDICDVYDIKDIVFEVDNKSLTNRPDLWGHYGIAREIAAIAGRELKPLELLDLSQYDELEPVDIKILDDLCYRYSGIKVKGIKKKVSPVNMRIRLFYCGTRAINLLADLTNYLMLEMGQPMHAFDCAKVNEIRVKRFTSPFTFKTLDDAERNIDENTLMICNDKEPVAVAGIMGGLASEIEDDTDSLLLESANFDAVSIRKSSTRLGLRTDASMRYEKTLDPEMTADAIRRFLKLLKDIDPECQIASRLSDVYNKKYPVINLSFDKKYVDRYTGIDITDERILSTLNALGFKAELTDGVFNVTVPSWRATKDVTIKADIIEEITRIYGYDNFKITTTTSPLYPVLRSNGNYADGFAKDILVEKYKLHEVHSYIWCDAKKYKELNIEIEDNVKLINAMNPDNIVLRNCMIPTLLTFTNENKTYAPDFGIFEIARVVDGKKENGECNERKKLGVVLFSRTKTEKELYFKLRDVVMDLAASIKHVPFTFKNTEVSHNWQHPKNTADILLGGEKIGFINTLHPAVLTKIDKKAAIVACEIDMDAFADTQKAPIKYQEPSKFPGIDIDLSLDVTGGKQFSDIEKTWENKTELLKNVSLIDIYEDGGKKSITVRLSFVSAEKTLSKAEVQDIVDSITADMAKIGVNLKG
ncbi:MAG: phenylalanine--tRNA ligase subunit beta [Ruminococcaceae bacterium]|nr:phenylalanine--tRNA ligase subunit beta [Oscillospiraceae bacterium]